VSKKRKLFFPGDFLYYDEKGRLFKKEGSKRIYWARYVGEEPVMEACDIKEA